MNFQIKYGCSRISILIFNYCIKLPNLIDNCVYTGIYGKVYSLSKGIQHNITEYKIANSTNEVCPVHFSFLGLINIMPRCRVLTIKEFDAFDFKSYKYKEDYNIPVENKPDSFGWYKNKIVAIDYH